MLLPGEKELADILQKLVKTAKDQEATIPEQGQVLHEMGELYLKDAIETGNGEQFVKASALINAALVRTENENDQKKLQELKRFIYQGLLQTFPKPAATSHDSDFNLKTNENQAYLKTLRQEVYTMSEGIQHFFNTYSVNFAPEIALLKGVFGEDYKMFEKNISMMERLMGLEYLDPRVRKLVEIENKEGHDRANIKIETLLGSEGMEERINMVKQMFKVEDNYEAWEMAQLIFESENMCDRLIVVIRFLAQILNTNINKEQTIGQAVDVIRKNLHTLYKCPLKDTELEEQLLEEVRKVSQEVQIRIKEFVKRLWEQALEMYHVPPPCEYAVIGLGSLARQEITPYSDLEFALLIKTDSKENKQYFKNLVYLFHLLILDLGETPIPAVAIESLNDFLTPGGDRFFDRITPCGFRLDGAMPWACKTPLGRKETLQKEALDLIKTPEDMAALQMEENSLGQAYHLADILCNYTFIYGDAVVFDRFRELHTESLSKNDNKKRARANLIDDYKRSPDLNWRSYNSLVDKNKTDLYRITSTFVENLRMYFTPVYQPESVWKVLDHLKRANILSWEGAFKLKFLVAICFGFRLLTYFKNNGQYENFTFMKTNKKYDERAHFSTGKRNKCYVAFFPHCSPLITLYAGIGALKAVVEKYFMDDKRKVVYDLKEMRLVQFFELTLCSLTWTRHGTTLANLEWARTSSELPSKTCGEKCLAPVLAFISYIEKEAIILEYIDELLTRRECKCLLLVRRNLLVSKAILIQRYSLIGEVPKEANVLALQENYRQKKYKNVRERYNLLMDMGELALLITDKKLKLSVAENITAFFYEVVTFEDSQQKIVYVLKCYLLETSIKLYRDGGKPEKGAILCAEEIEEYEKEWGYDNYSERLGFWYLTMGDLKGQSGSNEQLHYLQKAFDIFLFVWENTGKSYSSLDQPRKIAYSIAKLHEAQGKVEDAFEVLKNVFTEDGKAYHIETDKDFQGMVLLYKYLEFVGKENEYCEETLEFVTGKAQSHQLPPPTVLQIAEMIMSRILYLEGNHSLCPRDCKGSKSKEDFLIETLIKLLDNEFVYSFLLSRAQLDLDLSPSEYCLYPDLCTWTGYLFRLCSLVLPYSTPISSKVLVSTFRCPMTVLEQAGVFCERVVKKCATNTIYKMCLVYVEFNRKWLSLYHKFYYRKDMFGVITVICDFPQLNKNVCQFFPNCHKADEATDILFWSKQANSI